MTKEENNRLREEFFKEYEEKYNAIVEKAKADDTWCYHGLDSNSHLFEELRKETYAKLKEIRENTK